MTLLAHGIGGRSDLPLPGEVVLQVGGFVVLVSFLAVGLSWRAPRYAGAVRGRPLPAPLSRTLDHPALRPALRGLALALTCYVLALAVAGPTSPTANPAPYALYVLAWVGLVPASLLFGPVWRVVNPLRAVHALAASVLGVPVSGMRELPKRLGYWPAAASLAGFTALELVAPDRDVPVVVGAAVLGYGVVHTGAAVVFGAGWFERGEGFEAYSTLIGSLAVLGRDVDGRLVWRSPLRGLAAVGGAPGLVALLAVWWGSTVFDGLTGTAFWAPAVQGLPVPRVLVDSVVLAVLVAVVAGSYRLATGALAGTMAHSLVPIAVGYTVAHYTSLLITEGPHGLALLTGGHQQPPVSAPAPLLVAAIQLTAILLGHVTGVLAAHNRALAVLPEHRRLADQVPLVLVMVAYTMVGLLLLVLG